MSGRTALTALFLIPVLACGNEAPEAPRTADTSTSQAELDEARIQQLAQQFPRLGAEPLPEPQPSPDADPADVPERVRRAGILEYATGEATFYGQQFEGRRTASGIPFRQNQLVAAHRAYPFGTILRVTNTRNDRSVNVRVVDRGPHGSSAKARNTIIDLSRRAAAELDYISAGRTPVRVEVLEWGRGISG